MSAYVIVEIEIVALRKMGNLFPYCASKWKIGPVFPPLDSVLFFPIRRWALGVQR